MSIINQKLENIFRWHKVKSKIQLSKKEPYFIEREVWWLSLGVNIGYEEDGKNEKFERPVLILKKFNQYLILVVPLSSKIKNNKYYFELILNGEFISALLFQFRIVSSKRLIRRIGIVDLDYFEKIKNKIKNII